MRLLSTRAFPPRRQSTILPATGWVKLGPGISWHSGLPSVAASTSGFAPPELAVMLAPIASCPLPRRAVELNVRSCVLAPTDVTHGADAGLPVVAAPGPVLPFDAATHTLASAANRNAMSSAPVTDGAALPIE